MSMSMFPLWLETGLRPYLVWMWQKETNRFWVWFSRSSRDCEPLTEFRISLRVVIFL